MQHQANIRQRTGQVWIKPFSFSTLPENAITIQTEQGDRLMLCWADLDVGPDNYGRFHYEPVTRDELPARFA